MIDNSKISEIINEGKNLGFNIRVRDIAFSILQRHFSDPKVAYMSVFTDGKSEEEINKYIKSKVIDFISGKIDTSISENIIQKKKKKVELSNEDDISFEENKAEIIKLIEKTQKEESEGKIKVAESLKIQTDLRVKLNDKFNIIDDSQESLVVVNKKFNDICPYCSHEIAIPTKKELMKKYNLVENKEIEDERISKIIKGTPE